MAGQPLTLRPARQEEAKTIRRMVRRAGLNPLGLDWRRFTVAVNTGALDTEDRVVGCIQLKPHNDSSRELASLVVAPEWQSQGLARRLITQIKKQSGPPLWLMCGSHLVPFYNSFGFREVEPSSELPPYFRRIRRLFTLFRWLTRYEEYLAVMVWE